MPTFKLAELALPTVAFAAMLLATPASAGVVPRERPYEGLSGVVVEPRTQAELAAVLELARDVIDDRVGLGPLHVLMDADGIAALGLTDIAHEVAVADIQGLVDAERARLRVTSETTTAGYGSWFDDFKDLDAINAYIDELVAENPDIARAEVVGDSLEGRTIRALRIGDGSDRPTTVFMGTQHAREWISTMVAMCLADTLVRDYGNDPDVTALVDAEDVIIVPVANPDGYELTWNGERYWRKNTRDGHGIDLNRNWSFDWGVDDGSSDETDSNNYRGPEAFSEPETAALRDYMLGVPGIDTFVDLHSFGQKILFPYGCRTDIAPDHDEHEAMGLGLFEVISDVHDSEYDVQAGSSWYPACGVAPDWFYGELGAYSFTIELRPRENPDMGSGFSPPPDEILTACEEIVPSVIGLALGNLPEPGDDTGTGTGSESGTGSGSGTTTGGPDTESSTDGGGAGSGDESTDSGDDTELPPGGSTGATSSDEEPKEVGSHNDRGCACRATAGDPTGMAAFLLPLLALLRRRRA